MSEKSSILIEMFYTLTCPGCRLLGRMLDDILPDYGNKFKLKKSLANTPKGYIRTLRLNIHAVPALLINNKVIFKSVPTKEALIKVLNSY